MTTAEQIYVAYQTVTRQHQEDTRDIPPIAPYATIPTHLRLLYDARAERFAELVNVPLPQRLHDAYWTGCTGYVRPWHEAGSATRLLWQEIAFAFLRIEREVAA